MSHQHHVLETLEARRLLSAGALDPSFGSDGVVVFPDIAGPVIGLATQSDGKFVLATHTTLYRFRAGGTLDRSFGHRGHITPGFTLYGVGIDHNGGIAVGGGTADFKWAAARYKPDGTPDTAFNGTGQNITHVNGNNDERASVMALEPDGQILVGGTQFNGNNDEDPDFDYNAAVVRFNTDGTVDTGFGSGGEAFDSPIFNAVDAIAVAPNGDIAIAGREDVGMSVHDEWFQVVNAAGHVVTGTPISFQDPSVFSSFRAAYYRPDGTRVLADEDMGDSSVFFDDHRVGVWFNPLAPDGYGDEKINAIVTTADNKTVLAGLGYGGNVGLVRFNPDGTPDNTFGFGGFSAIDLNRKKLEWIDRLALLPNGDFLAAGSIGVHFADSNGEGGDPGRVFIAHIKGDAHPVGGLAPRAGTSLFERPLRDAPKFEFTVTYAAEETIDESTLDNRDVRVVGPNGYSALAHLVSVDDRYAGRQRIATYTVGAPGGMWNRSDNGHYTLYLRPNQVQDNRGLGVPAQILGGFKVHFPRTQATASTAIIPSISPVTPIEQRRKDKYISDLLS